MDVCVGKKELLFNVANLSDGKVDIDLSICKTLFDVGINGIGIRDDIKVVAELRYQGRDLVLSGSLLVPFEMVCSRCLKNYNADKTVCIDSIFREKAEEVEIEEGLDESSPDLSLYESDRIDIFPLIRDQIYLSIPMKPLCSEDCKGVCPKCGVDRNGEACNCVCDNIDPRLEMLKSFAG